MRGPVTEFAGRSEFVTEGGAGVFDCDGIDGVCLMLPPTLEEVLPSGLAAFCRPSARLVSCLGGRDSDSGSNEAGSAMNE